MGLARGTRLLDRYVLEEQIGQGGMATIMTARDERSGKLVAIKQMMLGTGSDAERQRTWFKREIKAMMILDHPGVPRLLDHGPLDDEAPYIVIEYLRGFDLERALKAHGPMPEGAVMLMTVKLLSALAAAHALSIVHRDIKPANIFLCYSGRSVLLDFGLARATSEFFGQTLARGNATALAGTPQYFAPEQVSGETKLSAASDLFSLGASLYHVLSGRGPFEGGSLLDTLGAIRANSRRPLASSAHWLHPRTVAFVEHLLAYDPNGRPQSAGAALSEAEALLVLFPDAEATLRKYVLAMEHNEKPQSLAVPGTQEVPALSQVPATIATHHATHHATSVSTAVEATVVATVQATAAMPSPVRGAKKSRLQRRVFLIPLAVMPLLLASSLVWRYSSTAPDRASDRAPEPAAPKVAAEVKPDAPLPEPTSAPQAPPVPADAQQDPSHTPAEHKRVATGNLVLRLRQWAEVSIDAHSYGRKQVMATFQLTEGAHTVELRNTHYPTKKLSLTVRRNNDTHLEVDFEANVSP